MREIFKTICMAILIAATAVAAVSCGPDPKPDKPVTRTDRSAALGLMRTGDKYMASKQYATAYRMYSDAVKSDPGLFEAHVGRQDAFFAYFDASIPGQVEQRKQLVEEYGDLLKAHGGSAEFLFLYGNMLDKSGQRTKAAGYLRRAIDIDPTFYRAHLVLADICDEVERSPRQAAKHRAEGRKFQLVSECKSAVDKHPYNIAAHRDYQDALFKMENTMPGRFPVGGLENTYAALAKKHAGTAHEATFRYLWGRVLGMVAKPKEAQAQFEHARSLKPKMAWAHDGLATCHLQSIRDGATARNEVAVDKAIRLLETATRLAPTETAIAIKLVKARQMALQIYNDQLAVLEKQIEKETDNKRLAEHTEKMNYYFIKIHETQRACHNELINLTSKHPDNVEGYTLLTSVALADGAFLFAQSAIRIAEDRAKALSESEAAKQAEVVNNISTLKGKAEMLAESLAKNSKMATAYRPVIFFYEEMATRSKSENAALRKGCVALATFAALSLQGQIAAMPEAIRPSLQNELKWTVSIIAGALADTDAAVKLEAVRGAGVLRLEPFADDVAAIMKDPQVNQQTKLACIQSLYAMRARQAIPALIEGLKSDDESVRKACIKALQTQAGRNHGYYADDAAEKRNEAIAKWEQWWKENAETFEFKDE